LLLLLLADLLIEETSELLRFCDTDMLEETPPPL
jgi:hypothetical protein